MRVMFLDIATSTGVAVDGPRESGRPFLASFHCGSDGPRPGRAFFEYERWLNGMIERWRPEEIGYEAAITQKRGESALNSQVTAEKLLGLIAITKLLCYAHDLTPRACNIQKVRRHFCGNGHADKKEVWSRCLMLGWEPMTDDEADAAAGWDFLHGVLKYEALTSR